MTEKLKLVREESGFRIYKDGGSYRLVRWDGHQVYSAMPSDCPDDGETWYAPATDHGIRYVSQPYSPGYVRQMFNRLRTQQ